MAMTVFIILLVVSLCWMVIVIFSGMGPAAALLYDSDTSPAKFDGRNNTSSPLPASTDPAHWPRVTVIIPGRNEGHVLADTLGSICRMDYPDFQVVFVDDQSMDETAVIGARLAATYSHLTVIHNTASPPPGWMGKNWAIHQARTRATTDYLLFADSDMIFHPQCLRQALRLMLHRNVDLLSILPRPEGTGVVEQGFLLVALTAMFALASPHRSNNPQSKTVLTAGAFMLFRRDAYEAIGGHAAIKGQLIEDLALGGRAKSRGFRVFTVGTRELVYGRMYEGIGDTFRGGKKNVYAGLKYNPLAAAAMALGFVLVGALPPFYVLLTGALLLATPGTLAWINFGLAILVNLLALLQMARVRRFLQATPGAEFMLPLAVTFCLAVLAASVWDYYTGGNVWSGRVYSPAHMAHPDDALE